MHVFPIDSKVAEGTKFYCIAIVSSSEKYYFMRYYGISISHNLLDLNSDFLKQIKNLFKNEREIEVYIHPASVPARTGGDETSYLLSTEANKKSLKKIINEQGGLCVYHG